MDITEAQLGWIMGCPAPARPGARLPVNHDRACAPARAAGAGQALLAPADGLGSVAQSWRPIAKRSQPTSARLCRAQRTPYAIKIWSA